MNTFLKVIVIIFFAYAAIMGVMTLQYFFDRGDLKKASQVIYEYSPDKTNGKKLVDLMADQLSVTLDQLRCETEIKSRFAGQVFVECGPDSSFFAKKEANYLWVVDVVGARIQAQNQKAQKLMNQFAQVN